MQDRSLLVMFLLVTRLPSIHFVLTVLLNQVFEAVLADSGPLLLFFFQKEIRKSMNFKQDSERKIKRKGGMASCCDLMHARRQSRCHPYLSEEI